ncbi:MAG: hypothetical protein E7470_02505 [Ruminococcaceae bacterium]|nr:hypothetical protein [Oscillospiraceae bacterium]
MDSINDMLQAYLPADFDLKSILIMAAVFSAISLVLGFIGKFVFGKKSALNQSVSATIGILFIYIITIFIHSFGLDLGFLVSPLPFFSIYNTAELGTVVELYVPLHDYVALCGELLNMVILAFLTNVANSLIPHGKKFYTWLPLRILCVAAAMLLFSGANMLLSHYLPAGLLTWAPVILLALLVAMLLLGALKGLVGALLATVNPLIAVLYTFFFASAVGKMLSKAMLSTLLMGAIIYALNYFGVVIIAIGSGILAIAIPLLIVLLVLWYVLGMIL